MKAPFCSETPILTYQSKICHILQIRYLYIQSGENNRFRAKSIAENIANDSENDPPKDDTHYFFSEMFTNNMAKRMRGNVIDY
jgi:hypothetical protein